MVHRARESLKNWSKNERIHVSSDHFIIRERRNQKVFNELLQYSTRHLRNRPNPSRATKFGPKRRIGKVSYTM
jgi:hypothetical protein